MKRLFLTVVLAAAGWCAYAQNYMIVDSEKIFKSIDAYNTAIKDLDKMAEDYQKQVDDKFAEIETLYNNYQQQKASLSATTRQVLEDTILSKEKDATALQESLFGKDGTLMKKRLELIQPIQKRSSTPSTPTPRATVTIWCSIRHRTPRCCTTPRNSTRRKGSSKV